MSYQLPALLVFGLLTAVSASADEPVDIAAYQLTFTAAFTRNDAAVVAGMQLEQESVLLEEVRLRAPAQRYSDFAGDGSIERRGDILIWRPPAAGGKLSYKVDLPHRRNNNGYDAWFEKDWAIFRGDDLFPPAATVFTDGSRSDSRLRLDLPSGWSAVTPFAQADDGSWSFPNPHRSFDRPTGWIAVGKLGVRRDHIEGIHVAVAAPPGMGAQRVGMLALIRWTLPQLATRLPVETQRVVIVSAGDPMWRGGLSAPGSLYIHAERPLISEDGTSTLVHELIHVLAPVPAAPKHDWIDEGLAEYLTLRILRDSGSISARRYKQSIEHFRSRGKRIDDLTTTAAAGAVTARAVAVFHDTDRELQRRSNGQNDIFSLTAALMREDRKVDVDRLRELAGELAGGEPLKALAPSRIPVSD